jgi:hypothetical protein
MVAAISLFTIITISVILVRVGAVALRLTGLPEHVARFQALSAFTGTGYTTQESTVVVNHPIRRRIIGILMRAGNAGIVTIIASVVLSFAHFEATRENLLDQAAWLAVTVIALYFIAFSKWTNRQMDRLIHWALLRMAHFDGDERLHLLILPDGYQVMGLKVAAGDDMDGKTFGTVRKEAGYTYPLAVFDRGGIFVGEPSDDTQLKIGDTLLVYGKFS